MSKYLPLFVTFLTFAACSPDGGKNTGLQARQDSLREKQAIAYKPGFGDMMSTIQVHHNKLWFAGINQNWELADFEIHEIEEAIAAIENYHSGRAETRQIGMIKPALDSVESAIKQQQSAAFKGSYILLTNTCNHCHKATNYSFIQIKVPDAPPFSNQEFRPNHEQ